MLVYMYEHVQTFQQTQFHAHTKMRQCGCVLVKTAHITSFVLLREGKIPAVKCDLIRAVRHYVSVHGNQRFAGIGQITVDGYASNSEAEPHIPCQVRRKQSIIRDKI